MSTLVCVPIMVHDEQQALADLAAARDADADMVELRIDTAFSGGDDPREGALIMRLIARSPLPCIVTCRTQEEGGQYDGEEAARIALFERLGTAGGKPGEAPPHYIDCEFSAYARSANTKMKIDLAVVHPGQIRELTTSLILSLHDFNGRPHDLDRRILRMMDEPAASVLKVAFRARSLRDNLELFDILEHRDRPTIALCMGDFGLMSRVLAPKFGGFLTFASLKPQTTTAPGQPTVAELLDLYRFRSINAGTEVFGIIGWPIRHSLSPLVHNAGFEAAARNAVYLPLPIASDEQGGYESFKATLLEMVLHPGLDFHGASVTLPHKEHLLRLATQREWTVDPLARRIGAANTLVIERTEEGGFEEARVLNTDAPAAVECLSEALGDLREKRLAILGAGGVARAIALGAADAGAEVVIFNRTAWRAEALAAELGPRLQAGSIAGAPLAAAAASHAHAYINCTPVGMRDGGDERGSPIDVTALDCGPETVFFDTVYNPLQTPMLIAAAARGARVIDGVAMFVRQAERQFEAFTGKPPEPSLFDRTVRAAL